MDEPFTPTARTEAAGPDLAAASLPDLVALHDAVEAVRRAVVAGGAETLAHWAPHLKDPVFRAGAENLAHYLALRRQDLSALQPALSAYGLSSLGRSEARVLSALDALMATLGRLSGRSHAPYPKPGMLAEAKRALAVARDRLFGADPGGPATRIMVTLPSEAASDPDLARRLIAAGATTARINCAHDGPAAWAAMAGNLRAAARALGRECRILMDLAGPKCRIEEVAAGRAARLHRGDTFSLVRTLEPADGTDACVATITFPDIIDRLVVGAPVWINDGKLGARVLSRSEGRARLEVCSVKAKGARIKAEKGINFPGSDLALPPLADADRAALDVAAAEADLVGFSFVQRPADVAELDAELRARRPGQPPQPLVLKIETRLAVANLPPLIVAAGGRGPVAVMIARGDLAVELGFARLSEIQEEMLWLCEAAHVPVIWATQVLEGFVADGIPTRAEATDAAMSQRAECVMLNKGPYLPEAVDFLRDVLRRMDRHQSKKTARFGRLGSWQDLDLDLPDAPAPAAAGRA